MIELTNPGYPRIIQPVSFAPKAGSHRKLCRGQVLLFGDITDRDWRFHGGALSQSEKQQKQPTVSNETILN